MPVIKGTTTQLAEWAASFRLQDAPDEVVQRIKALVLDLLTPNREDFINRAIANDFSHRAFRGIPESNEGFEDVKDPVRCVIDTELHDPLDGSHV